MIGEDHKSRVLCGPVFLHLGPERTWSLGPLTSLIVVCNVIS
jgi:hypothetical protein